jgi:hypothetical protein
MMGMLTMGVRYTFDAVGNMVKIVDRAQQRIFHKGVVVEPSNEYTYDALYRLIDVSICREMLRLEDADSIVLGYWS